MPLLLLHTCITWILAGLIWHVQIVQYPLFHHVGRDTFVRYHLGHCFRIGLLVVPLLCAEAATAAWLIYSGEHHLLFLISLPLMALNWFSTAIYQAPIHTRLMRGYDTALVRRLVFTNWLRTLSWTTRALILGWLLSLQPR